VRPPLSGGHAHFEPQQNSSKIGPAVLWTRIQIRQNATSLVTKNQLRESARLRALNHFPIHQEIDFVTSVRFDGVHWHQLQIGHRQSSRKSSAGIRTHLEGRGGVANATNIGQYISHLYLRRADLVIRLRLQSTLRLRQSRAHQQGGCWWFCYLNNPSWGQRTDACDVEPVSSSGRRLERG
jgi:hypothetical protein